MDWFSGLFSLPRWQCAIVALVLTHITMVSVTIFLHRNQAHRALDLHPAVSHFFRAWLWLSTGMITKEWVAIHRKHHAKVETVNDPHSPIAQMETLGITSMWGQLWFMCKWLPWSGVRSYVEESHNKATINDPNYSRGVPDDWIERNLYSRYPKWKTGIVAMALIDVLLFGPIVGLCIWAVQMVWTPVFAAGVINGLGHWVGYRNFSCADKSTNIMPWGIVIAGEELHNNHHTYPTSAKLSVRRGEFDIGWVYIRALEILGLATVNKKVPVIVLGDTRPLDCSLVEAIATHRYALMREYGALLRKEWKRELSVIRNEKQEEWQMLYKELHYAKRLLFADCTKLSASQCAELAVIYQRHPALGAIAQMRKELLVFWTNASLSRDELRHRLDSWCTNAEASSVCELKKFSERFVRRLQSS